ncbi:MAG: hypothetical protein M3540_07135, partial [Actinomycetota bacterium]|nr:hypothetical protein [Actinomycetota bacterium]
MTTTITTTVARSAGRVRLEITNTATITSIIRADINGTRPVRTVAGYLPRTAGTNAVIYDYEPALSGDITYRVTTSEGTVEAWTTLEATPP